MSDKRKKILVYRTGHLGDTVCAIPAFRMIRHFFGSAELTLLCDSPSASKVAVAEVIRPLNIFDHISVYHSGKKLSTLWELNRSVRQARPDMVILLSQVRETPENVRQKKSFFRRCGVTDIRGHVFPTLAHAFQPNEPQRLVQLLRSIGVHGHKPAYDIPVDAASHASVMAKLQAVGVNAEQPFLIFCGGGKEMTQRWPLERYATVLQRVAAEIKWPIVGLGSPAELSNYRLSVIPRFPDLRLPKESLTVPEIFELCRLGAAWFGNDTGPMHVAAAVGCPVAAVLSARNSPGTWDPDFERHIIFRHRTECENCFLNECIVEKHRCMTAITEDSVVAGLLPFLASLPDRKRHLAATS